MQEYKALAKSDNTDQRIGGGDIAKQIARLRDGDHICSFYKTKLDLLDTLVPWVKEARLRGEGCVYIPDDVAPEQIALHLHRNGVNARKELDDGSTSKHTQEKENEDQEVFTTE